MSKIPLAPERYRFAALAADVLVFTLRDRALFLRLVRVDRALKSARHAGFPGALVDARETAEDAVRRILITKALLSPDTVYAEQLATFSALRRDPRGRVVSVAYIGLVPWEALSDTERADTDAAWWAPISSAAGLAYDHDEMRATAVTRLRARATYTTLVAKLMPKEFTLTELEKAFETVTLKKLDKRNFRKRVLKLGILTELPRKKTSGRSRPAQLYRFKKPSVVEIAVL